MPALFLFCRRSQSKGSDGGGEGAAAGAGSQDAGSEESKGQEGSAPATGAPGAPADGDAQTDSKDGKGEGPTPCFAPMTMMCLPRLCLIGTRVSAPSR